MPSLFMFATCHSFHIFNFFIFLDYGWSFLSLQSQCFLLHSRNLRGVSIGLLHWFPHSRSPPSQKLIGTYTCLHCSCLWLVIVFHIFNLFYFFWILVGALYLCDTNVSYYILENLGCLDTSTRMILIWTKKSNLVTQIFGSLIFVINIKFKLICADHILVIDKFGGTYFW